MPTFRFLLILLIVNLSFSQESISVTEKYDSIFFIKDEYALLYKKSKSALYDIQKQQFTIPYQKEYLHYFEVGDLLLLLTKDRRVKEYYWETGFSPEEGEQKFFRFDMIESSYELSFEPLAGNLVIINEYHFPYQFDYPLVTIDGADSVDVDGNYVYPPDKPGVCKAGIFNTATRTWEIKPRFRSIHHVENNFFVYPEEIQYTNTVTIDWYTYDNRILELKKSLANSDETPIEATSLLREIFTLDSTELAPGTTDYYYTYKDGKAGLVRCNPLVYWGNSSYEKLLQTIYELLVYKASMNTVVTYDETGFNYFSYDYDNSRLNHNVQFNDYFQLNTFPDDFEEQYYIGSASEAPNMAESNFSIQPLGDVVLIKNITPQYDEDYPLNTIYGGDSIDDSGRFVYPPSIPGIYNSGVYHLKKKEWIVSPTHNEIFSIDSKYYITTDLVIDSLGLVTDLPIIQTGFNDQGEVIAHPDDFVNTTPLHVAQKIIPGDTVFYAPFQHAPLTLIEDKNYDYSHVFFTAESNSKMRTYRMGFANQKEVQVVEPLTPQAEQLQLTFAPEGHGDFPYPLAVVLSENGDQFKIQAFQHSDPLFNDTVLLLQKNNTSSFFKVSYPNGMVIHNDFYVKLLYKDSVAPNQLTCGIVIEKNGQIQQELLDADAYENLFQALPGPISFSFDVTNDKVAIYNPPISYSSMSYYADWEKGISEMDKIMDFESENNSVWLKTNGAWKQQTRNYAELKPSAYGYIGRTSPISESYQAYYTDEFDYEVMDSLNNSALNKKAIYELLDQQLSPFFYKSYSTFHSIKDFSFGYQLYFNEAESILIDLTGNIICEEHFDNYYEENGELWGENKEIYDIDPEWGDIEFDDDGNIIILREAEKRKSER